jgi:hypothetical protein
MTLLMEDLDESFSETKQILPHFVSDAKGLQISHKSWE